MLTRDSQSEKCDFRQDCSFKYQRQAAVDYAHYYTQGQGQRRGRYIRYLSGAADSFLSWANPEYFFYKQNCAAFLSQCLRAGGIPEDGRWYHRRVPAKKAGGRRVLSLFLIIIQRLLLLIKAARWEVSPAWRDAGESFGYFSDPSSGFIAAPPLSFASAEDIPRVIARSGLRPGDIIYLKKGGLISHCLLVSRVTENEIYYCANRYTRYDMELSEGLEREAGTEAVLLCLKDEMKPSYSGEHDGK